MARKKLMRGSEPPKRALPQLRPLPWYNHESAHTYLIHVMQEVGRLGLAEALDASHRGDWQVAHELCAWFDDLPSREIGDIAHWGTLDLMQLSERAKSGGDARQVKPRIEITAEITSKGNLTVRWFPAGYNAAGWTFDGDAPGYGGSLRNRRFKSPPDFRFYVEGQQYASYRPAHELMFIRGVGNLRPQPYEWGPYAVCNYEVLDALLICATRAAFNQLIKGLREAFDVNLLNDFEFESDEQTEPTPSGTSFFTKRFVRAWRIVRLPDPSESPPSTIPPGDVVPFKPKPDES